MEVECQKINMSDWYNQLFKQSWTKWKGKERT